MTIAPHKENHLLVIPGKLTGDNFAKLKTWPGYYKWEGRNCVIRCTGENLQKLMNEWPDAEWIGGCDEIRSDYLKQLGLAKEVAEQKKHMAVLPDDSSYEYKREPMDHQRKAFLLSRDRTAFGLFMEQGTGKTKVTIDTACYLYGKGEIDMLIIVAWPNGVHRNWVEYELPEDMSVPYLSGAWGSNHATKKAGVALRKLLLDPQKALKVFAFNVEAFISEAAQEVILEMLNNFRCLLVIDQSASIKNPEAKRTKFLIDKCSKLATYRRVLDGAPVAEGASELYSQFKFLDPWIIGHDTWTGFKAEYCVMGYWNEIKEFKNIDQLQEKIAGHSYRVLADDCLDLPERVYKRWKFDLGREERRVFDEMRGQGLAFFEAMEPPEEDDDEFAALDEELPEHIMAHLALVKNLRLQQISSGWWPHKDDFRAIDKKPARLDALLKLLDAADGKAIIFSRFRPDLDLIQETLGDIAASYHGGIGEEARDEAKRRFLKDPKLKYLIGQPRSLGIGHTLTSAKHVIFYSNDPSLRMREECEKRVHRTGLKHKVMIWDLVASDTQDTKILNALQTKKQLANVIMQDPDNFFLHEN